MCDWGWDDMATAGIFGEMIADEMEEETEAKKENNPRTPEEMLETEFDYLGEEELQSVNTRYILIYRTL